MRIIPRSIARAAAASVLPSARAGLYENDSSSSATGMWRFIRAVEMRVFHIIGLDNFKISVLCLNFN